MKSENADFRRPAERQKKILFPVYQGKSRVIRESCGGRFGDAEPADAPDNAGDKAMNDQPSTDKVRWVESMARARGLDRALTLFPAAVEAAVSRGATALSPLPADFPAVTEPAIAFDPETFARWP
jgi:hypothetical protein